MRWKKVSSNTWRCGKYAIKYHDYPKLSRKWYQAYTVDEKTAFAPIFNSLGTNSFSELNEAKKYVAKINNAERQG